MRQSVRLRRLLTTLLAVAATIPLGAQGARPGDAYVGVWRATFGMEPYAMRVALEVRRDSVGELAGRLHAVDAPGNVTPMRVTLVGDSIVARAIDDSVAFALRGILERDTLRIVWRSGGRSATVELPGEMTRGRLEVAQRPQRPRAPLPYPTRDVVIAATDSASGASTRLEATLALPAGRGPHPVLVLDPTLVSPNWANTGHPILEVLADGLARAGVATLRPASPPDTGAARGPRRPPTVAAALARWLASDEAPREIARDRIGLLGHGRPGTRVVAIQRKRPAVSFLVLLGVPAARGDAAMIATIDALLSQLPVEMPAAARRAFELPKTAVRLIAGARDTADARRVVDSLALAATDSIPGLRGEQAERFRASLRGYATPATFAMLRDDPAAELRGARGDVLALAGTQDGEVPPELHMPLLKGALAAGEVTTIEAAVLPGLNHLLQESQGGGVFEYGRIEQTVSPLALQTIADWIKRLPRARGR